jgi:hypothetical protein
MSGQASNAQPAARKFCKEVILADPVVQSQLNARVDVLRQQSEHQPVSWGSIEKHLENAWMAWVRHKLKQLRRGRVPNKLEPPQHRQHPHQLSPAVNHRASGTEGTEHSTIDTLVCPHAMPTSFMQHRTPDASLLVDIPIWCRDSLDSWIRQGHVSLEALSSYIADQKNGMSTEQYRAQHSRHFVRSTLSPIFSEETIDRPSHNLPPRSSLSVQPLQRSPWDPSLLQPNLFTHPPQQPLGTDLTLVI